MADEWGPWIEHDGNSEPHEVVGKCIRVVWEGSPGELHEELIEPAGGGGLSWDWTYWQWVGPDGAVGRILRYRIRKPRALLELIYLVENLPAPHRERETT